MKKNPDELKRSFDPGENDEEETTQEETSEEAVSEGE